MKQEKFNIKIERNLLRANLKGKKANTIFPKVFGDKNKNDFITTDNEEYILKIKTPECTNISEAYNKFKEIINVVYVELYNLKEMIWPSSYFEELDLELKIYFSIDKEFYEEIKLIDLNLPEKVEDAYQIIKENFNNNIKILENTFGKIKIKVTKKGIELENIHTNYQTKNGILEDEVIFLIGYLFSCLKINEILSITELLKMVNQTCKKYHLKFKNAIDKTGKEL